MCLSGLTQIIYGVVMAGSAILTTIALFAPGWNTIENNVTSLKFNSSSWKGLLPWSCLKITEGQVCPEWGSLPGWLQCVTVCMILSLIVEVFAIVYNILTCLSCCCKKYIIHPLTFFAVISTILLAIAVIVYAANWSQFPNGDNGSQLGYAYWLAVGALILSAADVVIGAITVFLGDHCC